MDKDKKIAKQKNEIRKKLGLNPKPSTGSPKTNSYTSTPASRFYTEKEEVTLRFYQTPKALFNNPIYEGLSLGSKLMYSILRDRLDMSIKNDWKDEKGYIYLIFGGEDLLNLLEISKNTVTKYKRELVKYKLIIDKRLGQGRPNRIYVLKPEIKEFQIPKKWDSRVPKSALLNSQKVRPNDTIVNETNLNNVKRNAISNKKKRPPEKEFLAKEIAEKLDDDHSLGFYRKIVDLMPENLIYQALSEVKDTSLTGNIKKSKAALFTTVIKTKAVEHNINLGIKKTGS